MRILPLLITLILLLSGCSSPGASPAPRYEPPNKPGGRMCTYQCRSALEHCNGSCGLKERQCSNEMQAQAIKDYEAYTREQFMAHAPIELRPRDFERPEKCYLASCRSDCTSRYDDCFEKCGGKIVKPGLSGLPGLSLFE